MKKYIMTLVLGFYLFIGTAQEYKVQDYYTKQEIVIPMRDGVKLHTTIY